MLFISVCHPSQRITVHNTEMLKLVNSTSQKACLHHWSRKVSQNYYKHCWELKLVVLIVENRNLQHTSLECHDYCTDGKK